MWPENTMPSVTNGDTHVWKGVGCCHFISPDFKSIAVTVPFPTPFSIESSAGSTWPANSSTNYSKSMLLAAKYAVSSLYTAAGCASTPY